MTDPELISKFLAGDINAFNTLVWRWEKSLYNFVLRYLGDREAAKDVCQKTFIRVYQKVHSLRTPQRFSTWLYQIAVNMCRDEIKSRRRQNLVSLENLQENRNGSKKNIIHPAVQQSQPEAQANQRDLRELLARALLEVPAEQRVVIVMKEYQGLKFNEIAEILQTSVNTVKSRMYYGLSALRKVFKQWKIYEEMLKYEM